jgi:hypothetical protein
MSKNIKQKALKLKSRMNEVRRELQLAKLYPDAMLIDGAMQYGAQKSALLPDSPNLSPDEIDSLKAVLGF